MYMRELESYREEWNQCSEAVNENELIGPIDLSEHLEGTGVSSTDFNLPRISSSLKFRFSCSPYLRYHHIPSYNTFINI